MIGFNYNKNDTTVVDVLFINKDLKEISFTPDNTNVLGNNFSIMLDMNRNEFTFNDSRDIKIAVLKQYNRKGDIIKTCIFELGDVDFGSIDKFFKFTYKIKTFKDFYIDVDFNDSTSYLNSLKRDLKIGDILN